MVGFLCGSVIAGQGLDGTADGVASPWVLSQVLENTLLGQNCFTIKYQLIE